MVGYDMYADRDYKKDEVLTTYCSVQQKGKQPEGISKQQLYEYVVDGKYFVPDINAKGKPIQRSKEVYYYPLQPDDYSLTDKGRWIGIASDEKYENVKKSIPPKLKRNGVVLVVATRDIAKGEKLLYKSKMAQRLPNYVNLERDEILEHPYRTLGNFEPIDLGRCLSTFVVL